MKLGLIAMLILVFGVGLLAGCGAETEARAGLRVPIEIDRNRVIVPTRVNGSKPLNLILDTGMRFDGVYLFHKELVDQIDTAGAIEVRVPGAGGGEASTAVMIESGSLGFGDVVVDSQRVIISQSSHTQTFPTDGVIGWNLFGHYVVEIDYDEETIFLHDTAVYVGDTTWTELPVTLQDDLPYFEAEVEVNAGETIPVMLYIDLASGDALEMLMHEDQKYLLPEGMEESYLATGLSGDIHGYTGESERLTIAGYELTRVTTTFAPAEVRSKQGAKADGILGDDVMRRFNVVFDYPNSRLLLRPNETFDEAFR